MPYANCNELLGATKQSSFLRLARLSVQSAGEGATHTATPSSRGVRPNFNLRSTRFAKMLHKRPKTTELACTPSFVSSPGASPGGGDCMRWGCLQHATLHHRGSCCTRGDRSPSMPLYRLPWPLGCPGCFLFREKAVLVSTGCHRRGITAPQHARQLQVTGRWRCYFLHEKRCAGALGSRRGTVLRGTRRTAARAIEFAACCSCCFCSTASLERVTGNLEGNPCGPRIACTSCSLPSLVMRSSSRSISLLTKHVLHVNGA